MCNSPSYMKFPNEDTSYYFILYVIIHSRLYFPHIGGEIQTETFFFLFKYDSAPCLCVLVKIGLLQIESKVNKSKNPFSD